MKILCALSGIEFTCDNFPGTFYSKELSHPVFSLPQKRLLSYTGKWAAGQLTPTDSYLLFLAILNSSERVDFRVSARRTERTDAVIYQNMEYLVRTVIKINTVVNPSVVFPAFAITQDTQTLDNVHYWIEAWEESYKEFLSGYRSAHESAKLIKRESALQRLIKNPHKPISEYATQLADWAAIAGSFPLFHTQTPFHKDPIPCAEYWKSIIVKSTRNEHLYSIPAHDLKELLEHCEENIDAGSIYAHALFKALRHAQEKQKNFLGFGDFDLTSSFVILGDNVTVEQANLKNAIDAAPESEPLPQQYPNRFQYLRAKLRWDLAKKFGKE